jgi:hypothetical protein
MNVSARFEQPVRPDTLTVSLVGYLAAAILCADLRARSEGLAAHEPRLRAA